MKLFKRKAVKREVKRLRDELDALKMPALYTEQDGEKTALQQVRANLFSEYEPLHVANQIHTASDILANDDEINEFAMCLETSEGSFYYEIGDNKRSWENNPNFFALRIDWGPIHVGKPMTILDGFFVHRDRIIRYIPSFRGMPVVVGDTLNVDYKFDSSSGMRP
jgi:hypothetical protein